MIDFGRSVAASSALAPPDGDPVDPWAHLNTDPTEPRKEQIFPGTRPFSAPEFCEGNVTMPGLRTRTASEWF
jgi:hypothetical protein